MISPTKKIAGDIVPQCQSTKSSRYPTYRGAPDDTKTLFTKALSTNVILFCPQHNPFIAKPNIKATLKNIVNFIRFSKHLFINKGIRPKIILR